MENILLGDELFNAQLLWYDKEDVSESSSDGAAPLLGCVGVSSSLS